MVVEQSGEAVSEARYPMKRPLNPGGAAPGGRLQIVNRHRRPIAWLQISYFWTAFVSIPGLARVYYR
jgi:hypothetical protein